MFTYPWGESFLVIFSSLLYYYYYYYHYYYYYKGKEREIFHLLVNFPYDNCQNKAEPWN